MATSFVGTGVQRATSLVATDNNKGLLANIPIATLNTILPGFEIVKRVLESSLGIDITRGVAFVFTTFTLVKAFHYVYHAVAPWLLPSVTIPPDEPIHGHVLEWVSSNVIEQHSACSLGTRSLTAVRAGQWDADGDDVDDKEQSMSQLSGKCLYSLLVVAIRLVPVRQSIVLVMLYTT